MSTYLSIIRDGLPRTRAPRKVIVVGAGMAGLTAAYELLRAGHEPVLLEGQQRVGGRVYTLREPFSDGLYAEAGAMRIPRAHALTMGYVEHFGLKVNPFTMGNPEAYYYLHGQRCRIREAAADPARLGFACHAHEAGRTHGQLWEAALEPLVARLRAHGDAAWDEIVAQYDQFSTREFLESCGWSDGSIEMFGLLADQEALMNASFLELFREEAGGYYTDMVAIDGGLDRLPRAFLPALRSRIHFGAKMVALTQDETSVSVHYQTLSGRRSGSGNARLPRFHPG